MRTNEKNWKENIRDIPPIIWMMGLMLILFAVAADNYLSVQNILNILRQSVPLLILAIGQTMVVLTEGTDLSLGAQVSCLLYTSPSPRD